MKGRFAAVLLLAGCVSAGCLPDDPPAPVRPVADDAGRLHGTAQPRGRIISLVPGVTETIVAIGGAERLIARTQYDEQPELASLPVVGGELDPSVEVLAGMAPDLVVMWPTAGDGAAIGGRLDKVGIDWYGAAAQTVADFERHARNLGRLLHLPTRAESLISSVRTDLDEAAERWSGRTPARIFYVVQMEPPMTVGPGTFLDSIFVAGGAVNVFGDIEGNWPLVSLEQVVWRQPDHIVVPVTGYGTPPIPADYRDPSLDRLASSSVWSALSAVAEGRVVSVDASLFGRPGPRMGEAAGYLAYRLHETSGSSDRLQEAPDGSHPQETRGGRFLSTNRPSLMLDTTITPLPK